MLKSQKCQEGVWDSYCPVFDWVLLPTNPWKVRGQNVSKNFMHLSMMGVKKSVEQ